MSILADKVTKFYGDQKALNNVSFEIKTGEIVGFLGPNGAGKSTMMKIITGFIPATSGNVYINGGEVSDGNPGIRGKIGYLPENNPLYPEMYVKEYLGFIASFYSAVKGKKSAVEDVIEATGLKPEQNKKIGALSRGYRQRVGLAQALIHNPEILILDEATTGLDPNQIIEIRNLIKEAGKNKTVLFSTHIMQEVEAVCSRIIIIDKGIIVADAPKDDIYAGIRKNRQVIIVEFDREPDEISFMEKTNVKKITRVKSNTYIIEAEGDNDIRPIIFSYAVASDLTVLSMQNRENNLEDIFRQLTT